MNNKILKHKQNSLKNFEKKAFNYENTFDGKWSALMYEELIRKIKLQPFNSILDVGCGTGKILSLLLKQCNDIEAYGLDFSENMLKQAELLLGNKVTLVSGDADNLPWEDDFFDLLICSSSFHHYPEPIKVLKEMKRVIKSNGRLIIADPWLPEATRFLINIYCKSTFNLEGDVKIYSKNEFIKLLSHCGFHSIMWERPTQKFCIATALA